MTEEINTQHSYILNQEIIAKEDVMVIDNVPDTFVYGDSYFTPDLLIVLCHQGELRGKDVTSILGAHDVCVILPDQVVMAKQASDDYRATTIAISRQIYDQLLLSYPYTRHTPYYRRDPSTHLSDKQYNSLLDAINLLRTLTKYQSVHRAEMLTNLLAIMINMIGESHVSNHPQRTIKLSTNEQIFSKFYNALIQHHRESHEVTFYARICCLSPKHFSEVIRNETGISASEWIATYITTRAKTLLDTCQDHTIQQISNYLGFSEQSAFTRFFKRQTGMTPSKFKDR